MTIFLAPAAAASDKVATVLRPTSEYKPVNYSDIHAALKKEGFTWAIAAEAIGCSAPNLMAIAGRKGKSHKVANALAVLIGCDVKVVFPDIPEYSNPTPTMQRHLAVEAAKRRLHAAAEPALNVKSA